MGKVKSFSTTAIKFAIGAYAVRFAYESLSRYLIQGSSQEIWDEPLDYATIPNLFSEEDIEHLMEFVHTQKRFLTGKEAFMEGVQHMGEHVMPDKDGNCDGDRFKNQDGICTLTGRHDLAVHHFMTGGLSGQKEFFEKLIPSVYAFYLVMPKSYIDGNSIFEKMFSNLAYKKYMGRLCAKQGRNYFFRPQQVNVVMVTPGQDLPLHYDNGWFWGANRFSMPDWLTVAMARSGLWSDIELPQAQSVVYLHGTQEEPVFKYGGEYMFYPNGPGGDFKALKPVRGQGVIMNGGKTPHGGRRVNEEHQTVNLGSKDAFHRLEFQGNNTWYLMVNDDIVDHFTTDKLRMSFVWRGLCFNSEEEADSYNTYPHIPLETILAKFEKDLRENGIIKADEPRPDPYKFGLMIMRTYVKYPAKNFHGYHTFNYCIIAKKYPFLRPLLSPFCTDVAPYRSLNDQLPEPVPICSGKMHSNPEKCKEILDSQRSL